MPASLHLRRALALFWGVVLVNTWSRSSPAESPPETAKKADAATKAEVDIPAQMGVKRATHKVVGDQATGFAKRTIGGIGLASHRNEGGTFGGGALLVGGAALLYGPVVSARYLDRHFIGYDSGGVAYSLSAQMGVGARYELEGNHGPFARVEVRGEMQRMGGFYHSSFRFPGLQLGYGLDHQKWMLDVFAHGSASVTGRVKTTEYTRPVEGAFVGGAMSLGYNNWLLHSDVSHLLHFDGPFWDVRSSLCSYWGKKPTRLAGSRKIALSVGPRSTDYSVGFCTDFGFLSFPRNGENQQKTDLGLSIVFGAFSRLDRAGAP